MSVIPSSPCGCKGVRKCLQCCSRSVLDIRGFRIDQLCSSRNSERAPGQHRQHTTPARQQQLPSSTKKREKDDAAVPRPQHAAAAAVGTDCRPSVPSPSGYSAGVPAAPAAEDAGAKAAVAVEETQGAADASDAAPGAVVGEAQNTQGETAAGPLLPLACRRCSTSRETTEAPAHAPGDAPVPLSQGADGAGCGAASPPEAAVAKGHEVLQWRHRADRDLVEEDVLRLYRCRCSTRRRSSSCSSNGGHTASRRSRRTSSGTSNARGGSGRGMHSSSSITRIDNSSCSAGQAADNTYLLRGAHTCCDVLRWGVWSRPTRRKNCSRLQSSGSFCNGACSRSNDCKNRQSNSNRSGCSMRTGRESEHTSKDNSSSTGSSNARTSVGCRRNTGSFCRGGSINNSRNRASSNRVICDNLAASDNTRSNDSSSSTSTCSSTSPNKSIKTHRGRSSLREEKPALGNPRSNKTSRHARSGKSLQQNGGCYVATSSAAAVREEEKNGVMRQQQAVETSASVHATAAVAAAGTQRFSAGYRKKVTPDDSTDSRAARLAAPAAAASTGAALGAQDGPGGTATATQFAVEGETQEARAAEGALTVSGTAAAANVEETLPAEREGTRFSTAPGRANLSASNSPAGAGLARKSAASGAADHRDTWHWLLPSERCRNVRGRAAAGGAACTDGEIGAPRVCVTKATAEAATEGRTTRVVPPRSHAAARSRRAVPDVAPEEDTGVVSESPATLRDGAAAGASAATAEPIPATAVAATAAAAAAAKAAHFAAADSAERLARAKTARFSLPEDAAEEEVGYTIYFLWCSTCRRLHQQINEPRNTCCGVRAGAAAETESGVLPGAAAGGTTATAAAIGAGNAAGEDVLAGTGAAAACFKRERDARKRGAAATQKPSTAAGGRPVPLRAPGQALAAPDDETEAAAKLVAAAGSKQISAATGETLAAATPEESTERQAATPEEENVAPTAARGRTAAAGAAEDVSTTGHGRASDGVGTADALEQRARRTGAGSGTSGFCGIRLQKPRREQQAPQDETRSAGAMGKEELQRSLRRKTEDKKARPVLSACPWRDLCVEESGQSSSEPEEYDELVFSPAPEASIVHAPAARVGREDTGAAAAAVVCRADTTAPGACGVTATARSEDTAATATASGAYTRGRTAFPVSRPATIFRGVQTPIAETATGACTFVSALTDTPGDATPVGRTRRITEAGAAAETGAPDTSAQAAQSGCTRGDGSTMLAESSVAAAASCAGCRTVHVPTSAVVSCPSGVACLAGKQASGAATASDAVTTCVSRVALPSNVAAAGRAAAAAVGCATTPAPSSVRSSPTTVACLSKGEILRAVGRALSCGGSRSSHPLRVRPRKQRHGGQEEEQQQTRCSAGGAAETDACSAARKATAVTAVTTAPGVPAADAATRYETAQHAAGKDTATASIRAAPSDPTTAAVVAESEVALIDPGRQTGSGFLTRGASGAAREEVAVAVEKRWLTAAANRSGTVAATKEKASGAAATGEEAVLALQQLCALLQLHEDEEMKQLVDHQESENCCGCTSKSAAASACCSPAAALSARSPGDLVAACHAKAQNVEPGAAARGGASAVALRAAAAAFTAGGAERVSESKVREIRTYSAVPAAQAASSCVVAADQAPGVIKHAAPGAMSCTSRSWYATAAGETSCAAREGMRCRCGRGSGFLGSEQQHDGARQLHNNKGKYRLGQSLAASFGVCVVEDAVSRDEEAEILAWADIASREGRDALATTAEAATVAGAEAPATAEAVASITQAPATPVAAAIPVTRGSTQQDTLDNGAREMEETRRSGGTLQEQTGVSAGVATESKFVGRWVRSQSGRMKMDFGPRVNFRKQRFKVDNFRGFPSFVRPLLQRFSSSSLHSMSRATACKSSFYTPHHIPPAATSPTSAALSPSAKAGTRCARGLSMDAVATAAEAPRAAPLHAAAAAETNAAKRGGEDGRSEAAASILLDAPASAAAKVVASPADTAAEVESRLLASPASTGIDICAASSSRPTDAEDTVGAGPRTEELANAFIEGPSASAAATSEKQRCCGEHPEVFPAGSAACVLRDADPPAGMRPLSQADGNDMHLLQQFHPVELCLLDYSPSRGSHIDEHIDDAWFWGPRLLTFSLAGATFLSFISPTMCVPLSLLKPLLLRTAAARKTNSSSRRTPCSTPRHSAQGRRRSTSSSQEETNVGGCNENGRKEKENESGSSRGELAAEEFASNSTETVIDTASRERTRRVHKVELISDTRRGGREKPQAAETQEQGEPCKASYEHRRKKVDVGCLGRNEEDTSVDRENCVAREGAKDSRAATEEAVAAGDRYEGPSAAALTSKRERTTAGEERATGVGTATAAGTGAAAVATATAGAAVVATAGAEDQWRGTVWGDGGNATLAEGGGEELFSEERGGHRDEEGGGQVLVRVRVEIRIPVPPRSMTVVTGAARYKWAHAIRAHHVCERRVALTLRELSAEFLQGGSHEVVGQQLLLLAGSSLAAGLKGQ